MARIIMAALFAFVAAGCGAAGDNMSAGEYQSQAGGELAVFDAKYETASEQTVYALAAAQSLADEIAAWEAYYDAVVPASEHLVEQLEEIDAPDEAADMHRLLIAAQRSHLDAARTAQAGLAAVDSDQALEALLAAYHGQHDRFLAQNCRALADALRDSDSGIPLPC